MKHYFLFSIITFSLFISVTINAQVVNSEFVTIPEGTYMNIQGTFGLLNSSTGTINNSGTIIITGNYINNGNFNSGPLSLVSLEGPFQIIGGTNSTTFNDLQISGTGNKKCYNDEYIAKTLIFDPLFPEKITIGDYNLTLLPLATISNPANDKFVVTNGIGSLIKKSVPPSSDFLFPVGNDTLTFNNYKPVTLNYSGPIDTFAVRVEPGIVPTAGTDNSYCVQYTYNVEERNNGGNTGSLSLGWNSPTPQQDEGADFDRTLAYMWQYKNSSWNILLPATPGALPSVPATATDWYYQTSGITDFSSAAKAFILRNFQILSILTQDSSQATCENSTTTFSVSVTGTNIQYQWQENCGSGWTDLIDNVLYSGALTDSLTITNPGIGMDGCLYQCIAFNQYDTITSLPATLTVYSLPQVSAGNDTTIFVGNTVQLSAICVGGISYQWVPSTYLDNPNIQNPISSPLNDITYIVYVTDIFGCTETDTIEVTVDVTTDLFVPNAFSPNNDGQNDVLYVRGKGIRDLVFVIYDRWGEKIFETDDIKDGWDGTYNGKKLSTAVFVYNVKVTYYTEEEEELKGNVTLIR